MDQEQEITEEQPTVAENNEAIVENEDEGAESTPVEEGSEENEESEEPIKPEHDKIQKRIDKITREKFEALRAAQQARQELERVKRGEDPEDLDIDTIVSMRARELADEEKFNEKCNKTYERGVKEFKNFDKAVENLQLVGMNRDFLELVSDSDNGPAVLYALGQDLEEAERISRLPPVKMARELTKLELSLSNKTVKKQSSAPAPIKPLSGKTSAEKSTADMSDEEYMKWRRKGR